MIITLSNNGKVNERFTFFLCFVLIQKWWDLAELRASSIVGAVFMSTYLQQPCVLGAEVKIQVTGLAS